jgi:hypothetical protein
MGLISRLTQINDLEDCIRLTRNRFAFSESDHKNLVDFWRYLLTEKMAISAVIVNETGRLVAFGMSVFVTDEFAERACSALPPYYAVNIFEQWRCGAAYLPLLDASQIKRANCGDGLNVAVLHRGWENSEIGISPEEFRFGPKLYESFISLHLGFRIKRLQLEVYGNIDRERMIAFGFRSRTDYSNTFTPGSTPAPEGLAPYLMEATATDMLSRPYHPTTALFLPRQVEIYFSMGEQALLNRALIGEKDDDIAQDLGISTATIHKRWRSIFARVESSNIGLLTSSNATARGASKRHIVLRYLLEHPEELRPVARPSSL